MAGYRGFAKNVGLLTLANFGTKILGFLLVPLYTTVLTTAEYGTYDLVVNTIGLFIPIFTQNIVDSVLRFTMDKDVDKGGVLGIGIKHFLISLVPTAAFLVFNAIFKLFPGIVWLSPIIMLLYISQSLSGIVSCHVQGLNRFGDIAVSSVICSVLVICCNIVFLLPLQMGLTGYFLANTIGPLVQTAFLCIRVWLSGERLSRGCKELEHNMLSYSRPLIANNIAWWVNNASDRYVVTFFCGVEANGIYSVASKIPSILSVVQSIVNQAWTISAVSEFDPDDRNGFFSNMYAGYNCAMTVICSLIIVFNMVLAKFLYANDFFAAWQYAPFLTVSIVFGALAGYIGGILAAVKDSKEFARSSIWGAVSNIALNLIMVPVIGPLGAAIATMTCYWLTWFLRVRKLKKYINIRMRLARDYVSYAILVVQGIIFLAVSNLVVAHVIEVALFAVIIFLYRYEMQAVMRKGILFIKNR